MVASKIAINKDQLMFNCEPCDPEDFKVVGNTDGYSYRSGTSYSMGKVNGYATSSGTSDGYGEGNGNLSTYSGDANGSGKGNGYSPIGNGNSNGEGHASSDTGIDVFADISDPRCLIPLQFYSLQSEWYVSWNQIWDECNDEQKQHILQFLPLR